MLVAPQAVLGLHELRWMAKYAFSGEVLLAIPVLAVAYYLLNFKPVKRAERPSH